MRRLQAIPSASNDAFSYAVAMVLVPVLFGLLGAWIDGRVGTRPLFLLALGALGAACSFASAYVRYEHRIARHDEGKPWARDAATRPRPVEEDAA